jgi:hypothetical protein
MRLINADGLKKQIMSPETWSTMGVKRHMCKIIDNAPTVELFCSYLSDGEVREPCVEAPCNHERPQGKYVDISKLRLMTVEECAGHTIDYAMGWKACIEWIKKGGAE